MSLDLFQVDAFTDRPFAGNPAAVCLLDEPRDERWMQDVAREMNLSETAFLTRTGDGYGLRWFTPVGEVELCGHATLASAHVLWETGMLDPAATARFHTRSGLLTAEQRGEWIELDFPALPVEEAPPPAGLLEVFGEPSFVGRSRNDYLLELPSEQAVRTAAPDHRRVATLGIRGVIITARSSAEPFDFDEDPATGAAHCRLGPYWARRLGKQEFLAYQASARGGIIKVRLVGDRVKLGGQAVTVLRGRLAV